MGQGQSQPSHPALDANWVPLSREGTLFSNVNPYSKRTFRNTSNNQEVQEYELEFLSEYDFRQYLQELRLRLQPSSETTPGNPSARENDPQSYFHLSPYIYTVKYFVNSTLEDMCSTTYKGLLYAQKVDLRLKQINDIPLSDQLYLTKATLEGFKLLYEKFGYFDISEEMIFITREGKVKVWINCNLSKNEPLFIPYSAYRQSHGSQSDMLVQLLDMIEENSDSQQEGIHFRDYLIQKNIYNRLSFYRALDEFEAYCMEGHHELDASMQSIYELYHQDEPEHSEVLEMSVHRANQQEKLDKRVREEVSPINCNSFSDLQFVSQQGRGIVGSRASKRSEQPRHASQHTHEEFIRNKSAHSHTQKLPPSQSFPYNSNQNQLTSTENPGHPLNPRNLPLGRRIAQPGPVARQESPAMLRRPQSLGVSRNILPATNSRAAVIKFNYCLNSTPATLALSHHVSLPNPNPVSFPNTSPASVPKSNLSNLQINTPVSLPLQSVMSGNSVKELQATPPQELPKPKLPSNLMTIHSIQTESAWSAKQLKPFPAEGQSEKKLTGSHINYYSSDQTYTLDKEIAEDLQKFLGYSLNS